MFSFTPPLLNLLVWGGRAGGRAWSWGDESRGGAAAAASPAVGAAAAESSGRSTPIAVPPHVSKSASNLAKVLCTEPHPYEATITRR